MLAADGVEEGLQKTGARDKGEGVKKGTNVACERHFV